MDEWLVVLLLIGGFGAGFVDAVVGGGGLIQIPLLFSALPGHPPATLFGTNKIASIVGTAAASVQYLRRIRIAPLLTGVGVLGALTGSWFGANTVAYLDPSVVRPFVLLLLIAVAVYTFMKKDFGIAAGPEAAPSPRAYARIVTIGLTIGFYDGFFGPGTGSFFIFLLVRFLQFDFLRASATAKVLNFSTNLAAIVFFGISGTVLWQIGLAMAAANLLGAVTGSHFALRFGTGFVRRVFLGVVSVLILKMAYDLL
jgi:uncharacterized membrane protein YfcA